MKKKNGIKHVFICFLSWLMICLLVVPTVALDAKKYGETLLFDCTEYEEVMTAIDESPLLKADGIRTYSNAYKVYGLKSPVFHEDLLQGKDILSLLTEEYVWIVSTPAKQKISVGLRNNQQTVLGYSTPVSMENPSSIIQTEAIDKALNAMGGANGEAVYVICFDAPMYATTFVYIAVNKQECLLPFSSRPDKNGMENGKAYSVYEVQEKLKANFDFPSIDGNADAGWQGDGDYYVRYASYDSAPNLGDVQKEVPDPVWPIVVCGVASLLIVGSMVAYVVLKKRKV